MNTVKQKRKYFEGYVDFDIEGNVLRDSYNRRQFKIYADEFISYDGNKKLVIKKNNNIYDLSEYDFEKVEFYPQPQKEYSWSNKGDRFVIGYVAGGLKKKNFAFTDKLLYKSSYQNGAIFSSMTTKKEYYVTQRHFDEYFVPRMVNGIITDTFTFAKHGSVCWLTVVT